MTQQYVGTKIVTAYPQEKDGQPGYAVTYADGYTSWSPQAVFDEAYLALGNVSHLPDFQQRVFAEHAQLADRVSKLKVFLARTDVSIPSDAKVLLNAQLGHMCNYQTVLEDRIAGFQR